MKTSRILAATALVAAFAVSAAYAQQQQAQRLSGTIEKVEGNTITGKARDGAAITLKLPDNVVVTAVLPATAADIKPGAYIGSGAVPQADGSQKAIGRFATSPSRAAGGSRPAAFFVSPADRSNFADHHADIYIPAPARAVRWNFSTNSCNSSVLTSLTAQKLRPCSDQNLMLNPC